MENEKEKRKCKLTDFWNIYMIYRISRKGKKAVYKGIYDSGNLLVSQITGQGVCIIQKEQEKLARKKSQR